MIFRAASQGESRCGARRRRSVRPALCLLAAGALSVAAASSASGGTYSPASCPTVTYHTAPHLQAQSLCMNLGVVTRDTTPGTYLFLTPGGDAGPGGYVGHGVRPGAGLYQSNGALVWWHRSDASKVFNLTEVRYRGRPYLALWSGRPIRGGLYNQGKVSLYDQHYRRVGTVTAGAPFAPDHVDPHEFQITPQGDALIGVDDPVKRRIRGHTVKVLQYVVQKLSLVQGRHGIHTGKVLFQWDSLHGAPVSQSHVGEPGPGGLWDYFHGNSIAQDTDGNLLISSRYTWGVYKVSVKTGKVIWQVGARGGHRLPKPWCEQHDAMPLGHNRYSLYDDGGWGPGCKPGSGGHPARGLIIAVNPHRHPATVRLLRSYSHSPGIQDACCGSTQKLPDGHVLVGWGEVPEVTEYGAGGRVDLDLSMSNWSFRAFRFPWVGLPRWRPAVAAAPEAGGTEVWASWNGSTQVAAWRVLAGPNPSALAPVKQVPKAGFETSIALGLPYGSVAVQALSASGKVLRTSRTITPGG